MDQTLSSWRDRYWGPATASRLGLGHINVKEDTMATKFRLYRLCIAIMSFAALLEAIGAPRKFN